MPNNNVTIDPSSYGRFLTERAFLRSQLHRPILKMGKSESFPELTSGSVPYNPKCVNIVAASDFRGKFIANEGSKNIVTDALPPIDYRSPLLSEEDNKFDIKTKIYMPLSRALKNHGMTSSHDCNGVISQGSLYTTIISTQNLETRVVFEEQSESLIQGLLTGKEMTFPEICKDGRSSFLAERSVETDTAGSICPLILSRLLGHMSAEKAAYGVIITSGRAYFVWVTFEVKGQITEDNVDGMPAKKKLKQLSSENAKIHITEAIMIDDKFFFRIVFNFVLQTKPDARPINGVRVSQLLKTPSSNGGLAEGDLQQHKSSKNNTLISRLSVIPDFKTTKTLTNTLGLLKASKVIATEWYGVSAIVKTFEKNETNGEGERSHEEKLFESEVDAYEVAGKAGLWGMAVPKPLFAASDHKTCALCLTAGSPMPMDPEEWSSSDLRLALESVRHLLDVGINLSDIKPANFITTKNSSSDCGGKGRVMVIDLEDSLLENGEESGRSELPQWLLRGSDAQADPP